MAAMNMDSERRNQPARRCTAGMLTRTALLCSIGLAVSVQGCDPREDDNIVGDGPRPNGDCAEWETSETNPGDCVFNPVPTEPDSTIDESPGDCDDVGALVCAQARQTDGAWPVFYCDHGRFVPVAACGRGESCHNVAGNRSVACGAARPRTRLAYRGAPCRPGPEAACDFDRAVVLWCENRRWIEAVHCGLHECRSELNADENVLVSRCPHNAHAVGDRCRFSEGNAVCSTDGEMLVTCEDEVATPLRECDQDEKCRLGEVDGDVGVGCFAK